MTTVPPPNTALPQMLATAAASTGTIARPTPAVAALPPGSMLTGTVTAAPGPDPRLVMLTTAAGDIPLRTAAPLPDGATLTVEVLRSSPAQVTVRLVDLNGQALQQGLAQAVRPQPTPAAPSSSTPPIPVALPTVPGTPTPLPQGFAWTPSGPQPLATLSPISAYMVAGSEPTAATQLPAAPSSLPGAASILSMTGTELMLRVASVVLPTVELPTAAEFAGPSVAAVRGDNVPVTTASAPLSTLRPDPTIAAKLTGSATPASASPVSASSPTPSPGQPISNLPSAEPVPPPFLPTAPNTPSVSALSTEIPSSPTPSPTTPSNAPVDDDETPQEPLDNSSVVLPTRAGWPEPVPTPPITVVPVPPQAMLTGTVVLSQDGIPLVQTLEGQIQLNVRANLPPGTIVTLEISARQPPAPGVVVPPAPVPAPALPPLSAANTGWPTLTESIQVLQRADPAAAAQLANAIPDGGPRTALALMAYVQALRSGEPRQWPGDNSLRALERTGPRGAHLAEQLAGEVGEISRQVRDTPGDWRALPLPWQAGGRIERVRMVMREVDPEDGANKKKGGGGTRFLVDLDLSRLGPLQLDGMFRKESRSFDMMIRTRMPLDDTMRQDLAGLFANSNAAMNLVGGLSFQVVKKFPDPLTTAEAGKDKSGLWV